MQRVKSNYSFGVRHAVSMAGLMLIGTGAQASVTLSAGNIDLGSISGAVSGLVVQQYPGISIQQPLVFPGATLGSASASSSVSGSMNYYGATGSGNFSENDTSPDGAPIMIELERKGFGYRAAGEATAGLARARAETQWTDALYGNSSASANATWSDWIVISGGTGVSTANFSSNLNGTLTSANNGSAGYGVNIAYSTGAYCYYWYNACTPADFDQTLFSQTSSTSGRSMSTLHQEIDGEFVFEYDQPFRLTATLNVSAANGGVSDFVLSALSSRLQLPAGALLSSASGLPYVQAVPEAETWGMMLAGLGLVGFMAMRRRTLA